MVTIRDVAKDAGVSPATVSQVVNGLVGYSSETRERVEDAVRSLSYETEHLARGLKTRPTSVIGLLAPMVSDALAPQAMLGVEQEARESGYAVMLGRTGAKSAFIAGYLRPHGATCRVAGVILISAVITPDIRQPLGPNIPIISVAISDKTGSPSVWPSTTSRQPTTQTRLPPRHDRSQMHLRHCKGSFSYESGAPGLDELLHQEPDLTAIFAMSDEMGACGLQPPLPEHREQFPHPGHRLQ